MFFRIKKSGGRAYVQVVENKRVDGAVRQSVIANLGRADDLTASGALASLLASGAKLTDQVLLINALDEDADGSLSVAAKRIGGPLLFGRIWERLGIADVLGDLLKHRAFEFAVERAVFVGTLHRLFVSGSDRDCSSWMEDYDIPGIEGLTSIISIGPWLGSVKRWRRRRRRLWRRAASRMSSRRSCSIAGVISLPISLPCSWTRPACRSTARAVRRWGSMATRRIIGPT